MDGTAKENSKKVAGRKRSGSIFAKKGSSSKKSRKISSSKKSKKKHAKRESANEETESSGFGSDESDSAIGSDDSMNPFSGSSSSETSISELQLSPGRRSSTASHREGKDRFGHLRVPSELESIIGSASDDPLETADKLLKKNSFRQAYPRTQSSESVSHIKPQMTRSASGTPQSMAGNHYHANPITPRLKIGPASASSAPVVPTLINSEDDEFEYLANKPLSIHTKKDAFTTKRVYFALLAQMHAMQAGTDNLASQLDEQQRYTVKLADAVNKQSAALRQLNMTTRSQMGILSNISRGAVYGPLASRSTEPDVIVYPRKYNVSVGYAMTQEEALGNASGCGSWTSFKVGMRGFFCSCFDDDDGDGAYEYHQV